MKDKSWIIIVIMGIALTISIGYSIKLSRNNETAESTVTTTSIIEMTATTATIKNTLKGSGVIEYKDIIKNEEEIKEQENNQQEGNQQEINQQEANEQEINQQENKISDDQNNIIEDENQNITTENVNEALKAYQVTLTIENKNLKKIKVEQNVEITIKKEETNLNYAGKVKKINEDNNNKSTLIIEILEPDENIQEGLTASCAVILEKAENVVALPIEAIQKNELGENYVDVVQTDGTIKSKTIETGLSDDYYVEITSGLNVRDRVQIIKSSTTVVNQVENTTNNK